MGTDPQVPHSRTESSSSIATYTESNEGDPGYKQTLLSERKGYRAGDKATINSPGVQPRDKAPAADG